LKRTTSQKAIAAVSLRFEWDLEKAEQNLKKHRVSFTEATTIFSDPLSWTFFDPDHSIDENRYITIGLSHFGKLLIVAHTDRGDNIRLISARRTTRQERRFYEEQD
jgi:uncharacterized DUF497 family protein